MSDDSDDFALFREQVKVDRRIRSETVPAPRPQRIIKRTGSNTPERQQQAEFFFSDTFRAHFPEAQCAIALKVNHRTYSSNCAVATSHLNYFLIYTV